MGMCPCQEYNSDLKYSLKASAFSDDSEAIESGLVVQIEHNTEMVSYYCYLKMLYY